MHLEYIFDIFVRIDFDDILDWFDLCGFVIVCLEDTGCPKKHRNLVRRIQDVPRDIGI